MPPQLPVPPPASAIYQPSPVYLTGEEELRASSLANASGLGLTISGRILRPDGTISPIKFTHAPNSTRTIATTIVGLSEGWLLGLTVRATTGAPAFGQTWVLLELLRGGGGATDVVQTLGMGFVTANTPLNWPGGVNFLPTDGPGHLRSIVGTTPAAGAEISEVVPTGARWEFLAFRALFVTSAAVANRFPSFIVFDGSSGDYQNGAIVAQAASLSIKYHLAPGAPAPQLDGNNDLVIPAPVGIRLAAGFAINTGTANIQAGDQWSAIRYLVREWMTGE